MTRMSKNTHHTIVVFPDGQTWNTLDGCRILTITDESFGDLCDDRIDAGEITPVAEIILSRGHCFGMGKA